MCEEPLLVEAGAARRTGYILEILDIAKANQILREHYRVKHPRHRFHPYGA